MYRARHSSLAMGATQSASREVVPYARTDAADLAHCVIVADADELPVEIDAALAEILPNVDAAERSIHWYEAGEMTPELEDAKKDAVIFVHQKYAKQAGRALNLAYYVAIKPAGADARSSLTAGELPTIKRMCDNNLRSIHVVRRESGQTISIFGEWHLIGPTDLAAARSPTMYTNLLGHIAKLARDVPFVVAHEHLFTTGQMAAAMPTARMIDLDADTRFNPVLDHAQRFALGEIKPTHDDKRAWRDLMRSCADYVFGKAVVDATFRGQIVAIARPYDPDAATAFIAALARRRDELVRLGVVGTWRERMREVVMAAIEQPTKTRNYMLLAGAWLMDVAALCAVLDAGTDVHPSKTAGSRHVIIICGSAHAPGILRLMEAGGVDDVVDADHWAAAGDDACLSIAPWIEFMTRALGREKRPAFRVVGGLIANIDWPRALAQAGGALAVLIALVIFIVLVMYLSNVIAYQSGLAGVITSTKKDSVIVR